MNKPEEFMEVLIKALLLVLFFSLNSFAVTLPKIQSVWNWNDLLATRKAFIELLDVSERAGNLSYYWQLKTQIARTHSLLEEFALAHKVLDEVATVINKNFPLVKTRYFLERGRTFNSAGKKQKARLLFFQAYKSSFMTKSDYLTVDAAHMAAIAGADLEEKEKWYFLGVHLALNSRQNGVIGWMRPLLNNMGWDYVNYRQFEKAHNIFKMGLAFNQKIENIYGIYWSKLSIGRALRGLHKLGEALNMQLGLLNSESDDPYLFEEIAEIYLALNNHGQAKVFFFKAYQRFSKDSWFRAHEPKRFARIQCFALGREQCPAE